MDGFIDFGGDEGVELAVFSSIIAVLYRRSEEEITGDELVKMLVSPLKYVVR